MTFQYKSAKDISKRHTHTHTYTHTHRQKNFSENITPPQYRGGVKTVDPNGYVFKYTFEYITRSKRMEGPLGYTVSPPLPQHEMQDKGEVRSFRHR